MPEQPDAAVSLALDIDWLVMQVDEKTRQSALNIVWFYHIGKRMEWPPRSQRAIRTSLPIEDQE